MSLLADFKNFGQLVFLFPEYLVLFSFFEYLAGRRKRRLFSEYILHLGGLALFLFSTVTIFFPIVPSRNLSTATSEIEDDSEFSVRGCCLFVESPSRWPETQVFFVFFGTE